MGDVKTIVKTALGTLAVIWALQQFDITRPLVQRALAGQ